jgi:microfibrillar-associated protein 1
LSLLSLLWPLSTALPKLELVMSAARQWGGNAREKDRKGGVDVAKVRRYRPGQKPQWMDEGDDSDGDGEGSVTLMRQKPAAQKVNISVIGERTRQETLQDARTRERRVIAPAVIARKKETMEKEVQRPQRFREVIAPPADVEARREAVKQKILEEQREIAVAAAKKGASAGGDDDGDDSDDSDDGDNYTSSSDSSDEYNSEDDAPIARPVFVRKQDRQTLAEREAIEREELEKIEQEKVRAARQAQESRKIAQEKISAELAMEAAARAGPQGAEEIVTDDEEDPQGDYEKWKAREMLRLRRVFEQCLREREEEREKAAWQAMSDKDKERYLAGKTRAARSDARQKAHAKQSERDERMKKGDGAIAAEFPGKPERGAFFRDDSRGKN